jgi:hypothetical protein
MIHLTKNCSINRADIDRSKLISDGDEMSWLLDRARSIFRRLGAWSKRRPFLVVPLVIIAVLAAIALGMAYFVPDKLRNIANWVGKQTNLIAQVLPATLPSPSKVDRAYWLPQNWSAQERYWFHHTSQGTTTFPVPYVWFLALERPELSLSHRGLRDDDYLRRLGFIPSPSSKNFGSNAAQYGYHDNEQPNSAAAKREWLSTPDNPDALPVGFAKLNGGIDPTTGGRYEDQLGLTCAACHTGHLEYKNVSIRFDGGPSMVNLGELERAVALSIGYTLKIPGRFGRFAQKVEELTGQTVDRDKLQKDLANTLERIVGQKTLENKLLASQGVDHVDEGFGRLDALNRIGNQVFFTNFLDKKTGVVPDSIFEQNFARHDAPVSFPPLWDTPFFLWAQYDASVFNELVRNAGEALGVNAKINMTSAASGRPLFRSSVEMLNIHRFEEMLRGPDPFEGGAASDKKFSGLVSPKWKDAEEKFPGDVAWSTNEKKIDEGRDLYRRHCFECHRGPVNDAKFNEKWPDDSFWKPENPDRTKKNEKNWIEIGGKHYFNVVQVPVAVIGTDRQQSRVLTERRVHLPTSLGIKSIDHLNKVGGCGLLPDQASEAPFVLALMAVVDKTVAQWLEDNNSPDDLRKAMRGPRPNCQNTRVFKAARSTNHGVESDILAIVPHYRARPLNGVWATAPYLHNGSVPTLADMLLPQDKRPKRFCIGSRQFDPVNVGLVRKDHEGDACAPGLTDFDVSLLGNSNRGHSFEGTETVVRKLPAGVIGPELSDDHRTSLVEYLKTL